ncbi:MAG: hypothetical protein OXG84_18395, partial [Chloroflexi bacterium]|nr:hypothetical protein [Chloroflexota bacterium]
WMMGDAFAAHHLHGFTAAGHDALEQGRIRLQSLLDLHVLQDDIASIYHGLAVDQPAKKKIAVFIEALPQGAHVVKQILALAELA